MLIFDLYKNLMPYIIVSLFLVIILYTLSYLVSSKFGCTQKLSIYECGFEPASLATAKFNLKFYLILMLFILFDLEIVFVFPWAIALNNIGLLGFYSMVLFIYILILGFFYEYKKGALEW